MYIKCIRQAVLARHPFASIAPRVAFLEKRNVTVAVRSGSSSGQQQPRNISSAAKALSTDPELLVGHLHSLQTLPQQFMQPYSPAISQETLVQTTIFEETAPTPDHGRDHGESPEPLLSGESGGVAIPPEALAAFADAQPRAPRLPLPANGLSPPQTPSPGSRNRIAEYENASQSASKKRLEGPAFEVIKKSRKPGDKHSPIADLPNGMLVGERDESVKLINVDRDPHTCVGAPFANRPVLHLPRVASLP